MDKIEVLFTISLYKVERLDTGGYRRITIQPNGSQTTRITEPDGAISLTSTNGTQFIQRFGPDQRFGMTTAVPEEVIVETPSGLLSRSTTERQVELSDPFNPLSVVSLSETTTINNRRFDSTFDATTFTLNTISAEGRQITTILDEQYRIIETFTPGLLPKQHSYDERGRLVEISQGDRSTTIEYGFTGYIDSITDAENQPTHYKRDELGRLLLKTSPDQSVTAFSYDAIGNMNTITPPGRNTHSFEYSPVNLVDHYSPPTLMSGPTPTGYSYNLDKQLTQLLRPDGLKIDYNYDQAGRLYFMAIPRGQYTYNYDEVTGQVNTIVAPGNESIHFTYDGVLLTGEVWAGSVAGTVSRGYNNNFWVTELSVNDNSIAFSYDKDGLLIEAGALALTRDPLNGLIATTSLGSISTSQTYNGFAEMDSFTATHGGYALLNTDYTRDDLGRITSMVETIEGITTTYQYHYDLAGRLDEVRENGVLVSQYVYDDNGNRVGGFNVQGAISGSYDEQDRITLYNGVSYEYTLNGELLTKTKSGVTTSYTYDLLGNLTQVDLPGGITVEYIIDGRNRRVGKKVNGVLEQGFLYQDGLNPVSELDGDGNVVSRFIYGSMFNIPDYMVKGGNTYRIISDHLGSPRLIIDVNTGTIVQRIDYNEFGNIISDTNPAFQPFGFAGGTYDQHTKLIRFGARDYDAEIGKWAVKDPIGFLGGDLNLYTYVENNPLNGIDPLGLYTAVVYVDGVIPHSAVYIGGSGRTPFLYDPAGSYQPSNGEPRGSGDFFEGGAANISDYINYHTGNGDTVNIYPIPNTQYPHHMPKRRI